MTTERRECVEPKMGKLWACEESFRIKPVPLIMLSNASCDGTHLSQVAGGLIEIQDSARRLFHWPEIPTGRGQACIQLNPAAIGLHFRIRDVKVGPVTVFEGVATIVFLPPTRTGSVLAEIHRLRPERNTNRLQDILDWLLAEYLLEFDGYDKSTFIDWIVSNVHLSAAELGGAEVLEDWYRKRAEHISGQGRGNAT